MPREGDAEFRDVIVMPGLAVDLFGREVLVPAPTRLDPALFAALAGDQKREVWIGFAEAALRDGMAARMICEGTETFARVDEGFRLFAGPQSTVLWDLARASVIIGGEEAVPPPPATARPEQPQLPPDGSAATQEFEAPDEIRTWLLRLGSVRWDGGAGRIPPGRGARRPHRRPHLGRLHRRRAAERIRWPPPRPAPALRGCGCAGFRHPGGASHRPGPHRREAGCGTAWRQAAGPHGARRR
ncbi:hypothetical protein [Siccirubricoccus sp. G192]|uniref:hypothetical protein n=1 Tax=Siccirubricoccus sp. G192 TaxID=2849651 RepID=UPI001C2CBC35|nr:hypothetical protein [Siccirubricoccus sp. G192]MBV1796826.1 hypothetical protein [Siccirubricoccus sp. G192]